jgi:hypothetical protein
MSVIILSVFYLIVGQDGKPVVNNKTVQLTERNQSLNIMLVTPENEGNYTCVVKNWLREVSAAGFITVTGEGR